MYHKILFGVVLFCVMAIGCSATFTDKQLEEDVNGIIFIPIPKIQDQKAKEETEEQAYEEKDYGYKENGTIRSVSAYNAGDRFQTDNTPCHGAWGDNICELLEEGRIVIAANFVPRGTKLYVQGVGEGVVLDRMNARYKNRVDVAMKLSEKQRALNFGVQNLYVAVVE